MRGTIISFKISGIIFFHKPVFLFLPMSYNRGLFKLYPLVPLCVSLIGGIVVGRESAAVVGYGWWFGTFLSVLAVTLFLGARPGIQTACILCSAFLSGAALAGVAERNLAVVLPAGETDYEAVVTGEPVELGRTLRFDMIVASGPLAGRLVRASLLKDTVECRYLSLGVGSGIRVSSRLVPPSNFARSNFDYVTYLKSRGIIAQTFIYHSDWCPASASLASLSLLERARLSVLSLRRILLDRYRALGLGGQEFAVTAAMTLGDKSALSADVRDVYSVSGASHILALSGMHLGIIYTLLSVLSMGRRFAELRECLLLLSIWAYVFLVGMSPSVLRAALMITVYGLVGLTGRSRMSVNALAFAAIVMLVASPLVLYDIGFQLSFMAVAFILVFQSSLTGIVPRKFQQEHPLVCWIWQLLVMSCLAQAGTAPLVAYYFGRLPVYFLVTNLIVIPAATVILYFSAAILALWAAPLLQQAAATVLVAVVSMLNAALADISSWPCASVGGIRLNAVQVILLYAAVVSAFMLIRILLHGRTAHLDGLAGRKEW